MENKIAQKKFVLSAKVSSDNPQAIRPCLERIIGTKGTIKKTEQGFEIKADFEGESAVVLNRMILSELRRAEKRTRIRSEWASDDNIYVFFDYVLKRTHKSNEDVK